MKSLQKSLPKLKAPHDELVQVSYRTSQKERDVFFKALRVFKKRNPRIKVNAQTVLEQLVNNFIAETLQEKRKS